MPSGVYVIRNGVTGKMYVGSAVDIARRLARHRYRLRTGQHPSRHLSASWKKYGEDVFEFVTLEVCDVSKLLEREQYWIDELKPEYNKRLKAEGNHGMSLDAEWCQEISRRTKEWAVSDEGRKVLSANSRRGWADPTKRDARIKALKDVWTPEKRAEQSERQKGIDNGEAARVARWSKPGASERASAAMKASWASRKKVTLEVIQELCDERGLELVSFDGQRVTVRCPKHDHTASPDKRKFVYAGQGCRFCGFERSSEKQKRRSDGP